MEEPLCIDCGEEPQGTGGRCRDCDIDHYFETAARCEDCGEILWRPIAAMLGIVTIHADDCARNDLRVEWYRLPRRLKKRTQRRRVYADPRAFRAWKWRVTRKEPDRGA